MLRIIRSGRPARAALLLAAALSISGSAGLHPEPGGPLPVRGGAHASASRTDGSAGATAHTCLVCLLYFSASLAAAGALESAPLRSSERVAGAQDAPVARVPLGPRAGRSPPSSF